MISVIPFLAQSAANSPPSYVGFIVAVIIGVFGGGSLVTLMRVKVDRSRVIVSSAEGAVIVQSGVIDDLQDEIKRLQAKVADLRKERDEEAAELNVLRAENRSMRARLARLENGNNPW